MRSRWSGWGTGCSTSSTPRTPSPHPSPTSRADIPQKGDARPLCDGTTPSGAAAHHVAMDRVLSRSRLFDAGLVLAVALAGLAALAWSPTDDAYRDPSAFAAVLVIASAASLWWWRTKPIVALLGACGVFLVNSIAGYQVGITQYPAYITFYAVFAYAPRRNRWIAVAALSVVVLVYAIADRSPLEFGVFVAIAIAAVVAGLLGDSIRTRRELSESLAREEEVVRE